MSGGSSNSSRHRSSKHTISRLSGYASFDESKIRKSDYDTRNGALIPMKITSPQSHSFNEQRDQSTQGFIPFVRLIDDTTT